MKMSESEGLSKLTEYLKQTKRQAEAAIDHLNEQIAVLSNDNEDKTKQLEEAYAMMHAMKIQMDKMKEDTSMKSVFKERDDWKSLVDSIQRDRARLQEENQALLCGLEQAHADVEHLRHQVQVLQQEKEAMAAQGQPLSVTTIGGDSEAPPASPVLMMMTSPIIDRRTGKATVFAESSPQALAQKLKDELKRVHQQMEEERRLSMAEQNVHLAEIVRLKGALISNGGLPEPNGKFHQQRTHQRRPPVEEEPESGGAWFSSMFGFFASERPKRPQPAHVRRQPVPRIFNV